MFLSGAVVKSVIYSVMQLTTILERVSEDYDLLEYDEMKEIDKKSSKHLCEF